MRQVKKRYFKITLHFVKETKEGKCFWNFYKVSTYINYEVYLLIWRLQCSLINVTVTERLELGGRFRRVKRETKPTKKQIIYERKKKSEQRSHQSVIKSHFRL